MDNDGLVSFEEFKAMMTKLLSDVKLPSKKDAAEEMEEDEDVWQTMTTSKHMK